MEVVMPGRLFNIHSGLPALKVRHKRT